MIDGEPRAVLSPYKGLNYYGERDAPFFFGRERETSIIAANLVASPLTLLYGPSGVGKSSLLRAGVVGSLRERDVEEATDRGAPGTVIVVFPADEDPGERRRDSWRDEPIAAVAAGIAKAVGELGLEVEPPSAGRLAELLAAWNERLDADLLLVLDQFEEYFLYHGEDRGEGSLLVELPRAVLAANVQANVLLSIREDAYAKLDAFKGRIPFLYENYLRVDHLDRAAARAAIVQPIEQYNRLVAQPSEVVAVEPALVDAVLEQVQTGNVVLGQAGRGGVDTRGDSAGRVETPFLQLVLERIWNEEARAGSRLLRCETLDRLGGADRIVRTHLDAAMAALSEDAKGIAAQAFRQLVTPSGAKIAHLPSDIAALEDLPETPLVGVLDRLAAARILRPIAPPLGQSEARYEIFHDVLAPAVLDWRARYREQLHERSWRRRIVAGGAVLAAVVLAGVATVAFVLVHNANERRAQDRRELLSDARGAFGFAGIFVGHHGAVRSGEFSADSQRILTAGEDGTIRLWAAASATDPKGGRMLLRLKEGGVLLSARFGPRKGLVVAAGEHGVSVWSLRTRQRLARLPLGPSDDAVFNPAGTIIAVAGVDGIGRLIAWPSLRTIAQLSDPEQSLIRSIAFSPNGLLVATASDDGSVRTWGLDGRQTRLPLTGSGDGGTAYDAAFSPSGRFLVTAGQDGYARVWDLQGSRSRPVATLAAKDQGAINTAGFSADGRFVVTGGEDTWIWDWRRRRLALTFLEDHGEVHESSFGSDDSVVVSADGDGAVRLWSTALPELQVEVGRLELARRGSTLRVPILVRNAGPGAAPSTRGLLQVRGFHSVSFAVPALQPGVSAPIVVRLPVPAAAHGKVVRVRATVDPNGSLTEATVQPDTASASVLLRR